MKRYILIAFCVGICFGIVAQPLPDSVKVLYNKAKTGSEKGEVLTLYLLSIKDGSNFFTVCLGLSNYFKNNNDQAAFDYVQLLVSGNLSAIGDFATALNQSLAILTRFENRNDEYGIVVANIMVSLAYYYSGDKEKSIAFQKKAISRAFLIGNKRVLAASYSNLGSAYSLNGMPDSGLFYVQQAIKYSREINDPVKLAGAFCNLAETYIELKKYDLALSYARESMVYASILDMVSHAWTMNAFAQIFLETNQQDSARYYARLAIDLSAKRGLKDQLQRAYQYLSASYEKTGKTDSAFKYYRLAINTKDSLFNTQKVKQVQAINFQEQMRKQEAEQEKIQMQNKIRTYAMLSGLAIVFIIAFFLYRNNRQKQKANTLLQQQKEKVEITLSELKSTQAQLIQSEKMASLGELTAGIAHEIQNPLNFVNNFSEVSRELIDELKVENGKLKMERDEKLQNEILNDLDSNLEKINHHGKRADAIVKGMLQHSQKSTGQKEPNDINALCDEYLRLAYHGLRAEDKDFNITFKTDFDPSLEKINIIPQDIGRVLLNLYNNAFYAVSQKQKAESKEYEPTVSVSTKKMGNKIFISVKDNGNGIPQNIVDKIFQPFFTTKPTGQGTGLGLSLSYDIIKAHGGEIKVETKEGEGSEFIIKLPHQ